MIDVVMIIVRWLAMLLPCGSLFARQEFALLPAWADRGPHRGGCYPASSPGFGGMTLQIDPIPSVFVSSRYAPTFDGRAAGFRPAPRCGM